MEETIKTFEEQFGHADWRAHAAKYPSSTGDAALPQGIAAGPSVSARIEQGRWIADCPTLDCSGAEFVSFDSPVFFCCECRNAAFGNKTLPMDAPSGKTKTDIEAVLLARADRVNRNWLSGETLAHLKAENRAQGAVI